MVEIQNLSLAAIPNTQLVRLEKGSIGSAKKSIPFGLQFFSGVQNHEADAHGAFGGRVLRRRRKMLFVCCIMGARKNTVLASMQYQSLFSARLEGQAVRWSMVYLRGWFSCRPCRCSHVFQFGHDHVSTLLILNGRRSHQQLQRRHVAIRQHCRKS